MIRIKNLLFTYPNKTKQILNIKELNISEGEKVFLFGPSGTGKTTLLEVLAGVLAPTDGSVSINNQLVSLMSAADRDKFRADHLSYIFQSFNLIPYLSVIENILLPIKLSSEKKKIFKNLDEANEKAKELCKKLSLYDMLDDRVTELSVGQQQRVAVARALIGRPKVILADEPTSALDQDHRERFLKVLFDLCRESNITLVFVSHDRSIEPLFDRSISLLEINAASSGILEYL